MQGNRGITLMALAATIMVLIILAGVSLATLTGENGILTRTRAMKEEYRAEVVQERVEAWKNEGKDYTTRDEMMWDLYKEGLITELELNLGKYEQQIKIANQTIDFGEDNGVKKIKVMENLPQIEYFRKCRC